MASSSISEAISSWPIPDELFGKKVVPYKKLYVGGKVGSMDV